MKKEEIKKTDVTTEVNEGVETVDNNENRRVGNIQVETKKGINKGLVITAIVLSVIAIAMVVFALVNKLNTNVYSNVYMLRKLPLLKKLLQKKLPLKKL